MLSAEDIRRISEQIKQGDAPDAIAALLETYLQRSAESDESVSETSTAHYIWDIFFESNKAVVRLDRKNTILAVNDGFTTLCKIARVEAIGRKLQTVMKAQEILALKNHPSDEYQQIRHEEYAITCQRDDGKTFALRVERFPDAENDETYLVFTDITEQKRFAEAMAQDSIRGEIFVDIVNSLWQDFMNYEKTLDMLTNKIAQHIGGSCIIHLLMPNSDIIEHVAINHNNPKAMVLFQDLLYATKWHASKGLPNEVILGGNSLLVPAVTADNISMLGNDAFGDCISKLNTKSFLMLPMYHNEQVIGTMTLLRTGTDEPYTNKDKTFTQRVANIGAMAIVNAQRMKRFSGELLDKLRIARAEIQHLRVLEAGFDSLALLIEEEPAGNRTETVLQLFADALSAEAAFLAVTKNGTGIFTPIAQWTRGDYAPILLERSEDVLYLPRIWTTPLEAGVLLHRTLDQFNEMEKTFLKDADILSIAIVPILDQERIRGILVFENCGTEEGCMDKNETILKTFVAIARKYLLPAPKIIPGDQDTEL